MDSDAVQSLIDAGEYRNAIARVEAALGKHKRDQRLLLQRGLALVQLDRLEEAESHYKRLRRWFRDNPEPGNNLAMVYRYMGRYDKAVEQFEDTIRKFPDYAKARENLGDTYVEMAARVYESGIEAIPDDTILISKLEIANRFNRIAYNNTPEAKRNALNRATEAQAMDGEPTTQPVADSGGEGAQPARTNAAAGESTSAEAVLRTLDSWITTWSERDVINHLAHYAREFDPDADLPLAEWIGLRRQELETARYIVIDLTGIQVRQTTPDRVTVTFEQRYESDRRTELSLKTLTLGMAEGAWLILREESRPLP